MSIINSPVVAAEMARVIAYAERTFHLVQPLFEDPKDRDGYVYTLRYGPREDHYQRQFVIKDLHADKIPGCLDFSEEKIFRATRLRHFTSMESANAELKHFPGAILMLPWSDSISGLKGFDDHCLASANAVRTERLAISVAYAYAGKDHEERLERFLKVLPAI